MKSRLVFRISILLLISLPFLISFGLRKYLSGPDHEIQPAHSGKTALITEAKAPQPVDLTALAEGLNTPVEPDNPAFQSERTRLISAQIEAAQVDLQSSNVEERVGGIEQLTAYRTRDAEAIIGASLQNDPESLVRRAAAKSLGRFKGLTDSSIGKLLDALQDVDSDVQQAASDALFGYLDSLDRDSSKFKKLLARLRTLKSSKQVTNSVKEDISEFLSSQKFRR